LTDVEGAKQVKTLRWLIQSILKYQRIQATGTFQNKQMNDQRFLTQSIQNNNLQLTTQLNEIQRSLNALACQSRIQQEDHFELERRLMEFKFGQDPMMLSSDSVFDNCSITDSLSIDMRNIDMNLSSTANEKHFR
jgi:hypothetical protein